MSEVIQNVSNVVYKATSKLGNNLAKLIDVKSLVTLSLTACFIYMNVKDGNVPEQFNNIYLIIVGFYFGTQAVKRNES